MIFQDPLTALNPVHRVGQARSPRRSARTAPTSASTRRCERAVELLESVGIPRPEVRVRQYPHEFSGGMRQRAMIAMMIANDPDVFIADEPTTALDVTIQAQILELIEGRSRSARRSAVVFITHDLGVIARVADRVQVMYAGRVAEIGSADDMFHRSRHPYTGGLLESLPGLAGVRSSGCGRSSGRRRRCCSRRRGARSIRGARSRKPCARGAAAVAPMVGPDQTCACYFAEQLAPGAPA